MSRPMCVNCGDPAADAWLCPVCEALKEQARRECLAHGQYWGDQINAAIYAALTQYREKKHSMLDSVAATTRVREATASSR